MAADFPEESLKALPRKIKSFKADKVHVYEYPSLGASRAYLSYDLGYVAATVYIYNWGYDYIENGINSEAVLSAKEESIANIIEYGKDGHYENIQFIKEDTIEVQIQENKQIDILLLKYHYDLIYEQEPRVIESSESILLLTALKNNIIKMRITGPREPDEALKKEIIYFYESIIRKIAK
jgi:hypothetical protein